MMAADTRSARLRNPRRGSTPTLTVVVASRQERAQLHSCLAQLVPLCEHGVELIVVRAGVTSEIAALTRLHPTARFIQAPHDATLRQLRAIGMAESTGDIVALADERSGCDSEWMTLLLRQTGADVDSHEAGHEPAGAWSDYFAERGLFSEWRAQASA